MTDTKLKALLSNLHGVLEKTDSVDAETRKLVSNLDEEINRLLDPESPENDFENAVDHARAVEARFAVEHPVAERFLREIIDTLSKVGI
jgi:hypothetical protein